MPYQIYFPFFYEISPYFLMFYPLSGIIYHLSKKVAKIGDFGDGDKKGKPTRTLTAKVGLRNLNQIIIIMKSVLL